jgi:ankyrin repeat protein
MQDPKQRRSKIGTVSPNKLIDIGDLIDLNHEPETTSDSLALRELVAVPTSERSGSQQSPIPHGYKDRNLLVQHRKPSAEQPRRLTSILENIDTPLQQGTAVKGSGITPVLAGAPRDSTQPSTTSLPKLQGDPPLEVKRRGLGKFLNPGHTLSSDVFSTLSTKEERSAIQLLRENQFDLRVKSFDKDSALCWAASSRHEAAVRLLLKRGADVRARDGKGVTALQAAAGGGHLEVIERLLTAKASVNAAISYHGGWTALQAAAGGSHFKVVERLLTVKADINASASDCS